MIATGSPDDKQVISSEKPYDEWLKPETWPVPKWYNQGTKVKKSRNYEAYYTQQLRAKYTELENDFRSLLSLFGREPDFDYGTAERVVPLLHTTRKSLEQDEPDLFVISNTLDFIERYMIWVYPIYVAEAKAFGILSHLESNDIKGKHNLIGRIRELLQEDNKRPDFRKNLRGQLDQAIDVINNHSLQEQINNGLQIERLKALRLGGLIMLIVFLIASPLVTDLDAMINLELFALDGVLLSAWVYALGIAVLGAIGGFLSGLLQVRSTRVTLTEYQESMLKLQLKPIVGALVALVSFVLLSWQILPGITIENAGSYIFVAFLSGFSERYFLRLLEIKSDEQTNNTVDSKEATDNNS